MQNNSDQGRKAAGIILTVFLSAISIAGVGVATYYGSRALLVSSIMGSITIRNWIASNNSEFSSLSSQLLARGLYRMSWKELVEAYNAKSNANELKKSVLKAVEKLKISVVINARGGGKIYYTVRESNKDIFSGQISDTGSGTIANLAPIDVTLRLDGNKGINSSISIN